MMGAHQWLWNTKYVPAGWTMGEWMKTHLQDGRTDRGKAQLDIVLTIQTEL